MKKLFTLFAAFILMIICTGCTREVKDYDLTVKFQEQELNGKYTGQIIDNIATAENASFTYKDGDNYLNYTGEFNNGQFSGKGKLETNFYIVKFENPDGNVDRVGEYKGDVVNAIAEGNGTYTATNDDNKTYTYTGEWKAGAFNGQGKRTWANNDFKIEEGNFNNSKFAPNKLEYLKYVGQDDPNDETDFAFDINDATVKYIETHNDLFPTNDFQKIKNSIDTSIEFKHLMKNINSYSGKMIKYDKGTVAAIYEYNNYGMDITTVQVTNGYGQDFYYIYYFGKLDDIYENDEVVVYGLPIDKTSFTNVSNTTTQAIVMLGSYITKR